MGCSRASEPSAPMRTVGNPERCVQNNENLNILEPLNFYSASLVGRVLNQQIVVESCRENSDVMSTLLISYRVLSNFGGWSIDLFLELLIEILRYFKRGRFRTMFLLCYIPQSAV